jgi:hypothetical protein
MINPLLHQQPVALDREAHKDVLLDLPTEPDLSFSANLNAVFLAASEFSDACREYAVVFVRSDPAAGGEPEYAPIAVLGLEKNRNIYLQDGRRWRADYLPVMLRTYPFCIGRVDDQNFAVCLDMAWKGVNKTRGVSMFGADGQPTEQMAATIKQLELLEAEIQRTRQVCARLAQLGAMKPMRFEATSGSGRKHSVDGFFTVDAEVMQKLPDATVGELHRNGMLGLVQLHWASMNGMRKLAQWHMEQDDAAAASAASAARPPLAS